MPSETRTAILLDETHRKVVGERMDEIAEIAVVKDQTPILWCETHDASVYIIDDKCGWGQLATDPSPCVLSTAHKWWKDV